MTASAPRCSSGTNTLLPCPFCGEPPVTERTGFSGRAMYIYCVNDNGCPRPKAIGESEDKAIENWNTRSPAVAAEAPSRDKIWHTIAKQIACEEDCQKWPNGCGCALKAADDVVAMLGVAQDAPEPVLTGLQEDLILMSFHNEPVPQVAQGSLDTQYRDGLEEIGRYAKKLRKSRDLIGPAEYANDAKAMKVWQRALYHEGKTIEGLVKAALRGAQLHEPEKTVTSSVPSTVAQGPLQQEELAAIIRTGMSFGKPAFAIAGNILAALALSSTPLCAPSNALGGSNEG